VEYEFQTIAAANLNALRPTAFVVTRACLIDLVEKYSLFMYSTNFFISRPEEGSQGEKLAMVKSRELKYFRSRDYHIIPVKRISCCVPVPEQGEQRKECLAVN